MRAFGLIQISEANVHTRALDSKLSNSKNLFLQFRQNRVSPARSKMNGLEDL